MKNIIKNIITKHGVIILILSVCIFIASKPLFHSGLFPTIDNISVVRLEEMRKELMKGQFPVRIVSDLARGRGYALFHFYAPLPFYVGSILNSIGINLVGALKRTYLVAFFIGTFGLYVLSKRFFGRYGGFISAITYVFSPYIGYDVFFRGGLGEVWALSFVPWVLWSLSMISYTDSIIPFCIGVFAFAALLISHNITSFIALPILLVWTVFWIHKKSVLKIISIYVLGFGISAFFLVPSYIDKSWAWVMYLQSNSSDVLSGLASNYQNLLFPMFIPMQTNWIYLIIIPLIGIIICRYSITSLHKKILYIALGISLLGIFLTLDISKIIWLQSMKYSYIIQFPWRIHGITQIFLALIIGSIGIIKSNKVRLIIGTVIIITIICIELPNFRPKSYEYIDKYRPDDPCGTTWGMEYLPIWTQTCLKQQVTSYAEVVQGTLFLDTKKIIKIFKLLFLVTEGEL
jgi:uncharacterized membrane protein